MSFTAILATGAALAAFATASAAHAAEPAGTPAAAPPATRAATSSDKASATHRTAAAPIVQTANGKVQGIVTGDVSAFLGIPYGADTGGAGRFLPPRPAAPWQGVRQAQAMGPRCPQPVLHNPLSIIKFSDAPISEDCLALNVWTRATSGSRPVMVWIHGGGFGFGSANDPYYEGTGLARNENVVVVSLNHRLNGFGYLDLGPDAGPAFAGAANVGQLDIVEALRWVKANIARFGGDPANVTIFGQSGGAGKISNLLAMPAARGLFHKAIIESGSDIRVDTPQGAGAQRDKVLAAFGLKPAEIGKLRDMPLADLVAGFQKAGLLGFRPWVDGIVLPTQPADPVMSPLAHDVPILLGTAHDEATDIALANPLWLKLTEDQMRMMIAPMVGPARVDRAIALYRARTPGDTPPQVFASVMTDWGFGHKAIVMATRKAAAGGAPVYVYRIEWKTPVLDGVLRSPHGVELPFVFDTVATAPELVGTAPQPGMVRLFQHSFATFARTGNPTIAGGPAWPAYSAKNRATFVYDTTPHVVTDPDADLRRFWDEVSGDHSEPVAP
jgi:para-nitrobenzyl esterase